MEGIKGQRAREQLATTEEPEVEQVGGLRRDVGRGLAEDGRRARAAITAGTWSERTKGLSDFLARLKRLYENLPKICVNLM